MFRRFLVFIENFKPEIKLLFLNRAFSHHFTEKELKIVFSELSESEIRNIIEIFKINYVKIPLSIKNLIEKFITVKKRSDFYFDFTIKCKP